MLEVKFEESTADNTQFTCLRMGDVFTACTNGGQRSCKYPNVYLKVSSYGGAMHCNAFDLNRVCGVVIEQGKRVRVAQKAVLNVTV